MEEVRKAVNLRKEKQVLDTKETLVRDLKLATIRSLLERMM